MSAFQIGKDVICESIPVCQYLDDDILAGRLAQNSQKGKAIEAPEAMFLMFLTNFNYPSTFFKSDNQMENLKDFQVSLQLMELTLKKNDSNNLKSSFVSLGMIDQMEWP